MHSFHHFNINLNNIELKIESFSCYRMSYTFAWKKIRNWALEKKKKKKIYKTPFPIHLMEKLKGYLSVCLYLFVSFNQFSEEAISQIENTILCYASIHLCPISLIKWIAFLGHTMSHGVSVNLQLSLSAVRYCFYILKNIKE